MPSRLTQYPDQEVNKNAADCEITVAFSPLNFDEGKTRDIFPSSKKI